MPRYPALEIQSLDVPRMFAAGSAISANRSRNALYEAQLGQVEQQNALLAEGRELRGAYMGGDESALAALAEFDPDDAAKLQDILAQASNEDRQAMEQQNLEMAQMAQYIDSAPDEMTRQSRWTEVRASSPEIARVMPESFDQDWADLQTARIMATEELLRQPPTGYQRAAGGLEFTPGGPADPAQVNALALAKQVPGSAGDSRTALQKDVPYIAKLAGISLKEALALKLESKDKSYEAYVRDLAARYASAGYGAERAFEQATAIGDLAYDRVKPPEAAPDSEEGRNWLQELFGIGGGGSAARGPSAKDDADKTPSQMSIEEIRAYTKKLKASGKKAPQSVLDALAARLSELGYN